MVKIILIALFSIKLVTVASVCVSSQISAYPSCNDRSAYNANIDVFFD
jgi:hypothetical protein